MGAGITNGKHIGINMGTINNIGEDVIHVEDKAIVLKGISYRVNENATVSDTIQLKYL